MSPPTLLFVSCQPQSVGHIYRVTNHAECLQDLGFRVLVIPAPGASAAIEALPDLWAVVVFRPGFDADVQSLLRVASQRGIPLVVDLDDLTFDPALLAEGGWPYWQGLDPHQQEQWRQRFADQRRAVLAADAVIVSTRPLAAAVESLGRPAWIWPNGFGDLSWAIASAARRQPQSRSGPLRIGYASGTPTHAADFAVVAPALEVILARHPDVRLTILGQLDLAACPQLQPFADQIETRPLVPYPALPRELRRLEINIAPLQISSRFCQAKSELKLFEAAAVGVPSVVSATEPFAAVVRHRRNGCLASTTDDWIAALDWLIRDDSARQRLARRAHRMIRRRFSPKAQRRTLQRLLEQGLFAAPGS